MDELLADFLTETTEHLQTLDSYLVGLEQDAGDRDVLNAVFRILHTIKGTCGFFGLPRIETVSHAAEEALDYIRDGGAEASPLAISAILLAVDRIRAIVLELETCGSEPAGDDTDVVRELARIFEEAGDQTAADADVGAAEAADVEAAESEADQEREAGDDAASMIDEGRSGSKHEPARGDDELGEPVSFDEIAHAVPDLADLLAGAAMAVDPSHEETADTAPDEHRTAAGVRVDAAGQGPATIRVSVSVLETLMAVVGELVLSRNQLLQIGRNQPDSPFAPPLQRLNQVTAELQETVMRTRMQPISNAWSRLPRLVRDTATDLGKDCVLVTRGGEAELDRQVLDLVRDPLVHMVRNAVDHGIEPADERTAAGKPPQGTVRLQATQEGGQIVMTLTDDGRGLDLDAIREKALRQHLIGEDEAASMTERQIADLIFAPGFSTAANVSSVSGRGVGMDVVRRNIERIGGSVHVDSEAGVGSCVTLKIPLTLAIVPALIVESSGHRFALPHLNVVELVRGTAGRSHSVEVIDRTRTLRLRDALIPLADLGELLGVRGSDAGDRRPPGVRASGGVIAVLRVGSRDVAIHIDRVVESEEIVVKPLAQIVRNARVFAGSTILGDGSVILILDPTRLGEMIAPVSSEAVASVLLREEEAQTGENETDLDVILIERIDGRRAAVPLADVSRLETVAADRVVETAMGAAVSIGSRIVPLTDRPSVGEAATATEQFRRRRKAEQTLILFEAPPHLADTYQGPSMLGLPVVRVIDVVRACLADMEMPTRTSASQDNPRMVLHDGRPLDLIEPATLFRAARPVAKDALDAMARQAGAA